ncbi:unnamed protein product [Merluccius merluccius]
MVASHRVPGSAHLYEPQQTSHGPGTPPRPALTHPDSGSTLDRFPGLHVLPILLNRLIESTKDLLQPPPPPPPTTTTTTSTTSTSTSSSTTSTSTSSTIAI